MASPSKKGKKDIEGWSIGLEKSEGDYCGAYEINNQSLIDALIANEIPDIIVKDVHHFYLRHSLAIDRSSSFSDSE